MTLFQKINILVKISQLLLMFLFINASKAISQEKSTIMGKIIDSLTSEKLPLATVTVFKASDSTILTYRLSSSTGQFTIPGLITGTKLRLIVSFSGYKPYRYEFEIPIKSTQLSIGTILMQRAQNELEEVLVVAEIPPVRIKKDTIEFNASSFKTLPNALVQDLLKKLPGVDVDIEGNITVNGKRVNRILVDGKTFFGDDPKIASQNLPANVIDKVQVTDDKEQLDANNGLNNGNIGKIINLTFKKGVKKGWFGKTYAGYGSEDRKEIGGIINFFRDPLQVSMLGFTNNQNKSGFSLNDISRTGGFSRSGINSVSLNRSTGGVSVNDISFGGQGQGIQTITGSGFNVNHDLNKKVSINTQYFFGNYINDIQSTSNTIQILSDTVLNSMVKNIGISNQNSHRLNFRIGWKASPNLTINYRPGITISNLEDSRTERTLISSSNIEKLLDGTKDDTLISRQKNYTHYLSIDKRFKKKGRRLYLIQNINLNFNDSRQKSIARNAFNSAVRPIDSINQIRLTDQTISTINTNITFTESLGKAQSLSIAWNTSLINERSPIRTFQKNPNSPAYDILDSIFTNGISRKTFTNNNLIAYTISNKGLTIRPTLTLQVINSKSTIDKNETIISQNVKNLIPSFFASYKDVFFTYNQQITLPSADDIQPNINNTNPLFIIQGNPDLNPTRTHSLYLNFSKMIVKKNINISLSLSNNHTDNGIIYQRSVDPFGVQSIKAINVNDIITNTANFSITKQIKRDTKLQLSFRSISQISHTKGWLALDNTLINQNTSSYIQTLGLTFNYKDRIEFNPTYRILYNSINYKEQSRQNLNVSTHTLQTEFIIRWPKNIILENLFDYRYNPMITPGLPKQNLLLTSSISLLALKENKGQFKILVYDVFNQNNNVSRIVGENYTKDSEINILKRYFLFSFILNIRNVGVNKVGGKEKLLLF